ncbi:TPA: Cyclin-dependent kinase-like 5 [Trebouxia sp. C0004]
MQRYEVRNKVGEGTYGIVLRCVHRKTGTFVAIKKFKESQDEDRVQRTAARELEMLRTLHHPNLVSFLESFRANGRLHLVFEFMDRTLLQDMEVLTDGLPAEDVQSHMFQLVHAVAFLHNNKVGPMIWAAETLFDKVAHKSARHADGQQCRQHSTFAWQ